MKNRLIIALILFSMTLHCSSRIGLISYLYQQRHEMAHALGLISEVPIAVCGSDYYDNTTLTSPTQDSHNHLPATLQAIEIILFVNNDEVSTNFDTVLLQNIAFCRYSDAVIGNSPLPIFQPPRV
ncbi:hypothetical protein [Pseudochryseolinea flava]|uniref:hypothetical protein n=1 Tax=Pseudochryseolinea flava TaxID=2059302 RepID=UPI001057F523|nr:hypothetical protein [Pseudochryseolinea flava]